VIFRQRSQLCRRSRLDVACIHKERSAGETIIAETEMIHERRCEADSEKFQNNEMGQWKESTPTEMSSVRFIFLFSFLALSN